MGTAPATTSSVTKDYPVCITTFRINNSDVFINFQVSTIELVRRNACKQNSRQHFSVFFSNKVLWYEMLSTANRTRRTAYGEALIIVRSRVSLQSSASSTAASWIRFFSENFWLKQEFTCNTWSAGDISFPLKGVISRSHRNIKQVNTYKSY